MALTKVVAGNTIAIADLNQIIDMLEGASGSTMTWLLRAATSTDFTIRLSDNAAAQKLSIVDSDGVEVASIDSNGGLTISGSFAPGTLDLPAAAGPSQTADGRVVWDSDDDLLTVGDGSSRQTFYPSGKAQAQFLFPSAASPAPTTEADAIWDTDDNLLSVGDGAASKLLIPSPTTTAGDVEYADGARSHARLAIGTADQYLRVNSGATAPTWSSPFIYAHKTADEAVSTSTTLQNDDDLSFAIGANEIWVAEWYMLITSNATADFKLAFDVPAGATLAASAAMGGGGSALVGATSETDAGNMTIAWAATGTYPLHAYTLTDTAGTSGTVQLQWAQDTSSGTTTMEKGSFVKATRIA